MADTAPDEKSILSRRKHILVLVGELLPPVVLSLLPFVLYGLAAGREIPIAGEVYEIYLRPAWLTFAGSAWLLIFWMRAAGVWTDYYLDVWTITDRRIIDREQKGLFHRRTSVLRLERIQDVTVETQGFIPTLFHFGDIHVQTAGEAREFVMRGIANPKHVREVILRTLDRVADEKRTVPSDGVTDN